MPFFAVIGAILAGIGVAMGAFGAHALEGSISQDRLATFETAVQYQMYHALALLIVAWAASAGLDVRWAGYSFLTGIVVFSGSLYVLVLTDTPWLGAITPVGGVAFIAGWGVLVWVFLQGST